MLLEAGANVNAQDAHGYTAFRWAYHPNVANSGDVLLLLVRSGYVPSEEDMNDFDLEGAEGKIS